MSPRLRAPTEVAGSEPEGRTTPLEELEATVLEPGLAAGETASEAPTPLPEALGSRPISAAVLRLTRIAKYELVDEIGHGSFGVVYTARDTELDREMVEPSPGAGAGAGDRAERTAPRRGSRRRLALAIAIAVAIAVAIALAEAIAIG